MTTPRRRILLALPAALVVAAFAGSSAGAATLTPSSPSPTVAPAPAGAATQGIIMRDGGVCDPIRHMGC
jgi:hypothetical protein